MAQPAVSTAFVLTGGGSLGAVQVGMLRALAEAGVSPDIVVGSSVGFSPLVVAFHTGQAGHSWYFTELSHSSLAHGQAALE